MPQHRHHRRRRQSRQPVGLANCLGAQPHHHITGLGRQAANLRIVEISGNGNGFITAQRVNISLLPVDIAGIAAIRLDLRAQGDRDCRQLWPQAEYPVETNIVKRQHVGRASHRAVTRCRQTGGAKLIRPCAGRLDQITRAGQRHTLFLPGRSPHRPDTADFDTAVGQTLIGIVGPQQQPIFSPRGEHPIGFGGAAHDQIVNHHTCIGIRPPEGEAVGRTRRSQCRVDTGDKSLCGRLLIACRAIDLASQKQPRHGFQRQRPGQRPRIDEIIFNGIAILQDAG